MTGMPANGVTITGDINVTWNTLTSELAAGSYLDVATKTDDVYSNGIIPKHAYAIFYAYTLSNGTRLGKISNPYGEDRYVGDYSNTSSLWTDALRKEVGSSANEEDSTFFIPIEKIAADFAYF